MKFTKSLLLTAALLLCLCVPVFAEDSVSQTDTAGNSFIASSNSGTGTLTKDTARDLFYAGQSLNVNGVNVGGTAMLAGQNVILKNVSIGQNLFAAGYQVELNNTSVGDNFYGAGYSVRADSTSKAAGAVYISAKNAEFDGTATALGIGAGTAVVTGTVNGDVNIDADTVIIESSAVITGTLHVRSANQPRIATGASIGELDYTLVEQQQTVQESAGMAFIKDALYWIAATIVMALMFVMLIDPALTGSARTVRRHPLAMLLTGFIAMIAAPIAFLLLLFLFITIPADAVLITCFVLMICSSAAFTGASLARMAWPGMNKWLSALAGAAIFGLATKIPFVGALVMFVSAVYTIGYFLYSAYLNIRKSFATPIAEVFTEEELAEKKQRNDAARQKEREEAMRNLPGGDKPVSDLQDFKEENEKHDPSESTPEEEPKTDDVDEADIIENSQPAGEITEEDEPKQE